jgi:hypothetical protein
VLRIWPTELKRFYAHRVESLPSPHSAWPLGNGIGRTICVSSRGHFPTLRSALGAALDGDTILLGPGVHDEGHEPVELHRSVRILGPPPSHEGLARLQARLVVSGGRGSICGVRLGGSAAAKATSGPLADQQLLQRCITVGLTSVWSLEDCRVTGSVRAGGQAELAIIRCRIECDKAQLPSTGVLVQGRARAIIRGSVVIHHQRSGITVQQSARLWLDHCALHGNGLAGLKVVGSGRTPSSLVNCVLSCTSISANAHMGIMVRGRSHVRVDRCRIHDNSQGVTVIESAKLSLTDSEISQNIGSGVMCRNTSAAQLEGALVRGNDGIGIYAANDSVVHLVASTLEDNSSGATQSRGEAVISVLRARLSAPVQQGGTCWPVELDTPCESMDEQALRNDVDLLSLDALASD